MSRGPWDSLALALALSIGCAREPAPAPVETFSWCAQPIAFSPPPPRWRREAENGGGMLGVRFVLSGGLGECISVVAFPSRPRDETTVLADVLPELRLSPARMQEPEQWRIGYEHDTTLAGHPAFASDDTLITPERPMLYQEVFWVVNGCAFRVTYQGTPRSVSAFRRLAGSITFPEAAVDVTR